jgi:4-hydroxy-tetrahydrodipicolinate synthase
VIKTVVDCNDGRLPLVLGVGGDTRKIVEELQTRVFLLLLLSVSPFYNKPTQEGIYQHFKAISQASPIPIIIYNVPELQVICCRKQYCVWQMIFKILLLLKAAGDMVQAMQIVKDKPKDFLVISGDDMIALPMVLAGGAGLYPL